MDGGAILHLAGESPPRAHPWERLLAVYRSFLAFVVLLRCVGRLM